MKHEKFYVIHTGEDNELGLFANEIYNKLINGEDDRIHSDGYSRLYVTEEFKKEVEKDYNIEFVPFREDFIQRMFDYDQVGEIAYQVAEEDKLLAFWEDKTFNEMTCKIIYRDTLNYIYEMPESEALKTIVEGYNGYCDFMWAKIKKLMYKTVLDKVKEKYKELA